MISIKIMGGLGNQMFQWAFARSLQETYGHSIEYDGSFYLTSTSDNLCKRYFALNKFPNIVFNREGLEWSKEPSDPAVYQVNDYFDYEKVPKMNRKEKLYALTGYWQSEKYFIENENIIRNNLEIGKDLDYNIKSKYNWIGSEDTVSIHIRRTDYLTTNGVHPVQPVSYYEQALDLIGKKKIIVFSDDIEWCKGTLKFPNMEFISGNDEMTDLYLMSMCSDHVIANSSFSWWGAWLNKNKDKKVIAPKKWFGAGGMSDKDIVPETWTKI